jgi:hypothetical protein
MLLWLRTFAVKIISSFLAIKGALGTIEIWGVVPFTNLRIISSVVDYELFETFNLILYVLSPSNEPVSKFKIGP